MNLKPTPRGNLQIAQTALDITLILAGALLYALSLVIFIRPLTLPLGGVTGLALVFDYLWGFPVGVAVILMNIPLFLLSFRFLGRRFLVCTMIASLASSLLLDALNTVRFLPRYTGDPLLGSLYGGLAMGAGMGVIFLRGATTGGGDILSKIIQRGTDRSIARINLVINAAVIVFASVIYRSMEAALYAMVIQYVSAVTIDGILTGMDNASAAFVITHDPEGMSQTILRELRRGVTRLTGTGMYTQSPRATLLCVVRAPEVAALKKLILRQDPEAFVVLLGAREVLGRGFKAYGQ